MKRWLALVAAGVIAAGIAAPTALATTTRIPVSCVETMLTEWTGGREWVDEDLVYHSRNRTADYRDVGDVLCTGINHATVSVNLDLVTGEGVVTATGHLVLTGIDGGWNGRLVAHFTPGGPYIWEGTYLAHGFGALEGYQSRGTVVEPTHAGTIIDTVVFLPGD
ncbi:MAG: hypothetical protein A2V85_11830 [Chloroflexi bacterium RBG_16_72_14]|nr:MAG: hypothetical protein A2V85_11830 [Chloroflexi bacterium RBG_16_72_14]